MTFRKILPVIPFLLGTVLAFTALSFHREDKQPLQVQNDGTIVVGTREFPDVYLKKINGGTFMMGLAAQSEGAIGNEVPAHSVTLKTYAISKNEVTQDLWEAVMGYNPSEPKGDNLPVNNVSWKDCQEFIRLYNQHPQTRAQGFTFRLPTEAEWEYAAIGAIARASTKFAGCNNVGEVAWYSANSGGTVQAVKQKNPISGLDIWDMSGNVSEWVQDKYVEYSSHPQTNPCVTSGPEVYVHRGGGYRSPVSAVRVTARDADTATYKAPDLGFRLATSL